MAIRVYKPTSPGMRNRSVADFSQVAKKEPERSLIASKKRAAGRNQRGKITVRHHGGGAKLVLRNVDFKRDKHGVSGTVTAIEYDPNRSARLALVQYADGDKRYVLATTSAKVGDPIMSGPQAEIRDGNALPLGAIPLGAVVHNIELQPGKGGQIVRSAGAAAQLLAKEGDWASLRLPSGEICKILATCYATIGQIGNVDHKNLELGKAGRKRHMGWRPTVRGSVMSPRDHPHGGGEGRNPIGHPGPRTPWGKPALGYKTRNNKRTNRFIVKRRK
ncbi:MAG: 50S ribosomal protein L2 [Chloroflexi bacterium]|nr:50S ribosomal protein L2 [Chloroflexota bacterium]